VSAKTEVRRDDGFQPRPEGFSRRVIGWALELTLENYLPLQALRMAFEQR